MSAHPFLDAVDTVLAERHAIVRENAARAGPDRTVFFDAMFLPSEVEARVTVLRGRGARLEEASLRGRGARLEDASAKGGTVKGVESDVT